MESEVERRGKRGRKDIKRGKERKKKKLKEVEREGKTGGDRRKNSKKGRKRMRKEIVKQKESDR